MIEVRPMPVSVVVPSPDTRVLPRPVCVRVSVCSPRAVWSAASTFILGAAHSGMKQRGRPHRPFPSRNLIRKLRTLANSLSLHPTPRKKQEDEDLAFGLCCVFARFRFLVSRLPLPGTVDTSGGKRTIKQTYGWSSRSVCPPGNRLGELYAVPTLAARCPWGWSSGARSGLAWERERGRAGVLAPRPSCLVPCSGLTAPKR